MSDNNNNNNNNSSSDEKKNDNQIDTTTLQINIKALGDLTTKEYDLIPFHPNMLDINDINKEKKYIFFPSFVKITMNDLNNFIKSNDDDKKVDLRNVFMDLDKYLNFIKYVIDPNKEDDPTLIIEKSNIKNYTISLGQSTLSNFIQDDSMITIQKNEPLTMEEIIINNIGLIKSIFFPYDEKFFILGNEYKIKGSNYIPKFNESDEKIINLQSQSHKISLIYTITVELELSNASINPDISDFNRLSCDEKKNNIAKHAEQIFGIKFGDVKEEKKVDVPSESTSPTTDVSKDRIFGQAQLDWEERNKDRKKPITERERLEMESKMTSVQKKMSELDKKEYEIGNVPPLWKKERTELDEKYEFFKNKINDLRIEYTNITKDNSNESFIGDLQDGITDNMYNVFLALGINIEIPDEIKELKALLNDPKEEVLKIPIIEEKKKEEINEINHKHIEPFLKNVNTIKDKIEKLEETETELKKSIGQLTNSLFPNDKKKLEPLTNELLTIQSDIRKKKAFIENEKDEKKIIQDWENILNKKKKLLQDINDENEKEIINKKKEKLDKKIKEILKEIDDLNKELLIAYSYEGIFNKITNDEKEEFKKKRPNKRASDIIEQIKSLEDDYINTSLTINESEKIQTLLNLYSDFLIRLSILKTGKEKEKRQISEKINEISKSIEGIKNRRDGNKSQSQLDSKNSDIIKEEDKEKNINDEINKLDENIKKTESKIYEIRENSTVNNIDIFNKLKKEYRDLKYTTTVNPFTGGNKYKQNRKSKRIHRMIKKRKYKYNTKRLMKNKNKNKSKKNRKTLRRLKNRIKKKKYTLRRRRI